MTLNAREIEHHRQAALDKVRVSFSLELCALEHLREVAERKHDLMMLFWVKVAQVSFNKLQNNVTEKICYNGLALEMCNWPFEANHEGDENAGG